MVTVYKLSRLSLQSSIDFYKYLFYLNSTMGSGYEMNGLDSIESFLNSHTEQSLFKYCCPEGVILITVPNVEEFYKNFYEELRDVCKKCGVHIDDELSDDHIGMFYKDKLVLGKTITVRAKPI